jgi:hypothetical protein
VHNTYEANILHMESEFHQNQRDCVWDTFAPPFTPTPQTGIGVVIRFVYLLLAA